MTRFRKRTEFLFCRLETLSCLSLRQGNAIISGSEDVKKKHVVLFSVTSLPGREWAERTYLSLSGWVPWVLRYLSDGQRVSHKFFFCAVIPLSPSLSPQFLDLLFSWWLPFISFSFLLFLSQGLHTAFCLGLLSYVAFLSITHILFFCHCSLYSGSSCGKVPDCLFCPKSQR